MMGKKFSRTKESYKNGGGMPLKQKRWPTTTKNGRDVEVEMLRVRKSINRALQSSTTNNNNNSREQVAKSHVYIMTAKHQMCLLVFAKQATAIRTSWSRLPRV